MSAFISELREEHSLPPAYKGPRGQILVALKRAGSLSARALGEHLGLSSNAIRHHLKELVAEGVIGFRREQRGVGAPTFVWHLSTTGESLFPQRYKELVTDVLDRVAEQAGRQAVVSALETRFSDLARQLRSQLDDAPPERRMNVVMQALVEGGYMAEWREGDEGIRLTEHNCAILALAKRFPEVCEAEAKFLEEVLVAAVRREAHMLDGCTSCEYRVQFPETGIAPLTALHSSGRPAHEEGA
jgi:DeoR family transcriptional regulator, suf operon transcriptional repressor